MRKLYLTLLLSISLVLLPITSHAANKAIPNSKQQIQLSFAPLVKKAAPAVVNIYTKKKVRVRSFLFDDPFFSQFFGRNGLSAPFRQRIESSLGSGILVREDGLIITNYHVIKNSDEITVELHDKREFSARVTLIDEKTDLALLRIPQQDTPYPTLELVNSDNLEIGDVVLAIGNAFGIGQTVTSGIVSALARTTVGVSDFQFFIQTDAAINPGNSGGPLINMNGDLVGINTAIYSRSGGSNGIGFATPANMAALVIQSEGKSDKVRRAWFGANSQRMTQDIALSLGFAKPVGLVINDIHPHSPAAKAGLEVGDIIHSINGNRIFDVNGLRYQIASQPIGTTIEVSILIPDHKEGAPRLKTYNIKLESPPEIPKRQAITLQGTHPLAAATMVNISPAVAEEFALPYDLQGVMIAELASGFAARFGFRVKDIIVAINGTNITTTRQLKRVLQKQVDSWNIGFIRNGKARSVRIGR